MYIKDIHIDPPVVLAPMAGITNYPYRILAKEQGCGLVCAEMVSDKGLLYGNERTKRMLYVHPKERPLSMQLFGSDVNSFVEAARIVDDESDADIIDINMGCPVPKVTKPGGGCALMRDTEKAEEIIKAVVKAVKKPVTVKMRKGWDENNINVIELAKIAEASGASAITVHGRTRIQMYSGQADWDIIKDVVNNVSIPVIGNGDVTGPIEAKKLFEHTGCHGIMIGRAAQGNPWIFSSIKKYLEEGVLLAEPTAEQKVDTCLRHLDLLMEFKDEHIAVQEMRKHAAWYLKGLPKVANVRNDIMLANTRSELEKILRNFIFGIKTAK
ncbi:tRNA dihydrouridine synthase DusB [Desulfuribacillus alkaliarsenatis]|uniref:tRNA-dihydrouridine synthase n=1 Tax=Desulfuribacillus alkaliarsenatis TaxID=766136 RepID=A0A1E5FZC3_9FIRM|nr:tRNA dihydrouridine synthase DusB [Desulfuribacillus alkaliarsenatis]OEF95797.1 tRNA dihydrouridine synthase DusB [Desulfuribacillus alkaliarsenatis]